MWSKLKRTFFPPDEYALLQTKPERQVVARIEAPIDPLEAEARYNLGNGRYQLQEIRGGAFGDALWSESIGDPLAAREISELKRELGAIQDELAGGDGDLMEGLPSATLQAVLGGRLSVSEAKSIADLHQMFEGQGTPSGLADSVDDPSDVSEVGGRALLQILDDPARLQELGESVGAAAGGAAIGAAQEAQQPRQPQRPRRPAQPAPDRQLDLGDAATAGADGAAQAEAATDGGEPGPDEPGDVSPAKKIYQEAQDAGNLDGDDQAEGEGGDDTDGE